MADACVTLAVMLLLAMARGRLGHFFGTSPGFWLNLQSLYEIRVAQRKVGNSIRALPTLRRSEPVHA